MTDSELVFSGNTDTGHYEVRVKGLEVLLRGLAQANPKLQKALKKALKEAASPVLDRARANARRISDDGTYESSLSIASRKNGAMYVLKTDDPAAPVKEFAHIGAKTISSKGTDLANKRLRMKSGVGVPRRAYAPRVMVPAINDSAEEVKDRIDEAMAKVMEKVANG